MPQTRAQTHRETITDTVISIAISIPINAFLITVTSGMDLSSRSVLMTLTFTALSYVRRYCTRRYFNWRHR